MFSCRVFVVAVLAMLVCASLAWAQDGSRVMVHFIVVPHEAAGGADGDQVLVDFKDHLLDLAGGYTELGDTTGGYLPPGGPAVKSPGVSFLVAAPQDISAEIKTWADARFASPAYVLAWPAAQSY